MQISKHILLPEIEDIDSFGKVSTIFSKITEALREHNIQNYDDAVASYKRITTGRIESQNGNTYFDLDSGVISGQIIFLAGTSGFANVNDASPDDWDDAFTLADAVKGNPEFTLVDGGKITTNSILATSLASAVVARMFSSDAVKTVIEAWRHGVDATLIDGGKMYTNSIVVAGLASAVTDMMFSDGDTKTNIEAWRKSGAVTYIDGNMIYTNTVTASQVNVVGLDVNGKLVLGQIGSGSLDNIGDGATYGKVALTSISAGKIIVAGLDSGITDRMFADLTTKNNIQAWRHVSDVTKIDGGDIYTNTVTANAILAGTITGAEITGTTLSGIFANLGTITAGNITLNSSGYICTAGKTSYADTDAGFWLGYSTGYKLNIGSVANYLKWTGSQLLISAATIRGRLTVGGGTDEDIYFEDSGIRLYDAASNILSFYKAGCVGLSINLGSTTSAVGSSSSHTEYGTNIALNTSARGLIVYNTGTLKMHNMASAPAGHAGDIAYNSTAHRFQMYVGGGTNAWGYELMSAGW